MYDGQPFYDKDSGYLYVGDGANTIENTIPVIASYADADLTKGTIEERLNKRAKSVLLYNNLTGLNIETNNVLKPIDIMEIDINTKKNIDYFIILCSDSQEGGTKELKRFTLQISPGDGDRYSFNQNNILLKQDEETESVNLNIFTYTQVNFNLKKREEKYVIQGTSSLRKYYIDGSKNPITEPYSQYVLQIYGVTETEKIKNNEK